MNIHTNTLNLTNGKLTVNGNVIICFYGNSNLATKYTGTCILLWPGTGTPTSTSTDWSGVGMNGNTLIYNVPSGMTHIFQVNGTCIKR